MTDRLAIGTVLGVQVDGTYNVAAAGTTYDGVRRFVPGDPPQVGSTVLLAFVGLQPVIAGVENVTPRVVSPTITVADSPPGGAGMRQVTSWYQDTTAGDSVPTLVGVRSSPAPSPTTASARFVPTAAGTWDEVNNWAPGDVMQGQLPEFPHPRKGLWLYPDMTSSQTVTGLQITVHRRDAGGVNGNVALRFCLHNYTAAPGGEPALAEVFDGGGTFVLSRNVTDTFTLPVAWGAALAAGTRTGVGIYSTNSADYGRFDGPAASGVLTFTYQV